MVTTTVFFNREFPLQGLLSGGIDDSSAAATATSSYNQQPPAAALVAGSNSISSDRITNQSNSAMIQIIRVQKHTLWQTQQQLQQQHQ
jgi:hypothetical protein